MPSLSHILDPRGLDHGQSQRAATTTSKHPSAIENFRSDDNNQSRRSACVTQCGTEFPCCCVVLYTVALHFSSVWHESVWSVSSSTQPEPGPASVLGRVSCMRQRKEEESCARFATVKHGRKPCGGGLRNPKLDTFGGRFQYIACMFFFQSTAEDHYSIQTASAGSSSLNRQQFNNYQQSD